MSRRVLLLVAVTEFVTLVVLLANLATVHVATVAAVVGPVHGCAYLAAIVGTATRSGLLSRPALLCLIPGVGGLLAVSSVDRRERTRA